MARDGSVGRETFEKVEALVKKGMNKSDAFKAIAQESGKNAGTVAANYYRVARATGAVRPRKRRKATAAPAAPVARVARRRNPGRPARSTGRNQSEVGVDQIAAQLVSSVQALTEAVKAQQFEISELRGRLEGVRKVLN